MGNASTIYDDTCLDSPADEAVNCPVYAEHLETMKFVTLVGKVLEKSIYQTLNMPKSDDSIRISWYQLFGQCIKQCGQLLPLNDPFRLEIINSGKAEKLVGQMENEFASIYGPLIYRPIEEIRLYNKVKILSTYQKLIDGQPNNNNVVDAENKNSENYTEQKSKELTSKEQIPKSLEPHPDLHLCIRRLYEILVGLENIIPAVIEFQLEMSNYSSGHLQSVLQNFQTNSKTKKFISTLTELQSEITSDIPDYRISMLDAISPADIECVVQKIESQTYKFSDPSFKLSQIGVTNQIQSQENSENQGDAENDIESKAISDKNDHENSEKDLDPISNEKSDNVKQDPY